MVSRPLRYSRGDVEKLKVYQALHGNDWKKIGELVSRSSLSVALKFSQISSGKLPSPAPAAAAAESAHSSPGPRHHCTPVSGLFVCVGWFPATPTACRSSWARVKPTPPQGPEPQQ